MVQAQVQVDPQRLEALGPAERILSTLTRYTDHLVHNRPGLVVEDRRANIGVRWEHALWKLEGGQKVVYKRKPRDKVGVMDDDKQIRNDAGQVIGRFQDPGLYPEAVAWIYKQMAEIWRMDNELAARFASFAWGEDHRDMKCVLAAFMLCQTRSGEPVKENGEVQFFDDDFRAVGEAMVLLRAKGDINPKMLLRIRDILKLPEIAEINRDMGFAKSARNPCMGRYNLAVQKWLRSKDQNPKLLHGLMKANFRTTVKTLACAVGYKGSPKFYEILRWKQKQAKDGRREVAIGAKVKAAEDWTDLSEAEICERIVRKRMNFKHVVGLLPAEVGLTRAIMMAVIEAGQLSDTDLLIYAPTLEELGLHTVPAVQDRLDKAAQEARDQRAANIATRVKSKALTEKLQEASDTATAKAMEKATRNMRLYWVIDKSGSMRQSLDQAKNCLKKCLGGFPGDRTHISVFNSMGTEITLKAPTAAGVEQAFRGHRAGGMTSYAEGFKAVAHHKPAADEDALPIFVGDECDGDLRKLLRVIRESGINPVAFGLLKVPGGRGTIVTDAARELGIPCFPIELELFNDPYTITRTLANLIEATPVGTGQTGYREAAPRKTLVQRILETPLLEKPAWAA
jgi:hypothetical protein